MTIDWNPIGRRVYFFTPHEDDETLFMGQVIAHHVLAGREVHIVLMSNGSTSNVLGELNGTVPDPTWWGGKHDPAHEGYEPLTANAFGLYRTFELYAAARQLGVPPERVHLGMDVAGSAQLPDSVSEAYAHDVIEYWMERCAQETGVNPGLYATHWLDAHSDHAHLGAALRTLRLGDADFGDSRWLVKPEQAEALNADTYVVPTGLVSEVKAMQLRAARAYGAWQPPYAYAIGMHSVAPYFNSGPLAGAPNHIVRTP